MNKNKAKKIATWIIVPLMAAIFILDIITVVLSNKYARAFYPEDETFTYQYGDDRIHFLNTANSDAIIIESNGKFAMIDAGEGNNNPYCQDNEISWLNWSLEKKNEEQLTFVKDPSRRQSPRGQP